MKQQIDTDKSAPAIGPYSKGIDTGQYIFLSGQFGFDISGELSGDDIETQTATALNNIAAVLEASGLDLGNVVKCQVFMTDLGDFARMNAVYEEVFKPFGTYPARAAIGVATLPKGALIEIDVIATRET
ncbi:MAG TPA: Rid family detoxifying hydrolase [Candidatus Lokiarchaeia archaeon]|nr:Rid family detoxifying hydrolase [Candidatus Lokiarchaeia archaeon]